jgi:hypothetical protein
MAIAATPTRAVAQGGPEFPALFGGSLGSRGTGHTVDTSVSLLGSYENNEDNNTPSSLFETTGYYTAATASLGYGFRTQKIQVGVNVGLDARHYPEQHELRTVNQFAGVGFNANFARRTVLSVNQNLNYTPAYFGGLFPALPNSEPGFVDMHDGDYAVSDENALSTATIANVSHGLTRTGTLSFTSSYRQTRFGSASGYDDLRSYSVGGRFQQRLTRYTALRLGYAYRQGDYNLLSSRNDVTVHDVDLGVDYARGLSMTRNTQLDFGIGSTVIKQPETGFSGRLGYHVLGNVGLNHQLSRTWRTRVAFNRGVNFVDGLPEPLFSNGLTATASGFVNRRIDMSIEGAYTSGFVGSSSSPEGGIGTPSSVDNDVTAYTATARAHIALSRILASTVEYVFYRYELGRDIVLPSSVPTDPRRHSVRAGLTLWLPLLRR